MAEFLSICGGLASLAALIGAVASLIVIWQKKRGLAGRYDHFDIDRIGGKELLPENKQNIHGGFLLKADWLCFLTSHGRIRHVHTDESKRVIKGYWKSNFWATELQVYWGDPKDDLKGAEKKDPPDEYIADRKPHLHSRGISLARKSEGVYEGYYVKGTRERLTRIQKTEGSFPMPEEQMLSMANLTKTEKDLLGKLILDQPSRPGRWSANSFTNFFDPEEYRTETIDQAREDLASKGIISCESGVYTFSEDMFIQVRKHFAWLLRRQKAYRWLISAWGFLWKHFIVTILTAAITAYITMHIAKWCNP